MRWRTATRPGDPDPAAANPAADAILSGDLYGDDSFSPTVPPTFTNYAENVYHAVTAGGTNATAALDGFTVHTAAEG